jgi:hypothetical protein
LQDESGHGQASGRYLELESYQPSDEVLEREEERTKAFNLAVTFSIFVASHQVGSGFLSIFGEAIPAWWPLPQCAFKLFVWLTPTAITFLRLTCTRAKRLIANNLKRLQLFVLLPAPNERFR